MTTGPWDGDRPLNARWRYSNGGGHFSWDVGMPIGTALYAIGAGIVVDCNDGVRNQPNGVPAGSGAPSNWIILRFTFPDGPHKGKTGFAYYQHMNKGLKVKRGQRVKRGQLLGYSGNSGNTSGPHLHLTVLKPGYTMTNATRYTYLSKPSMVVWTPAEAWGSATYGPIDIYLSQLRPGVDGSNSVRFLRKCLINRGLLIPAPGLSVSKPGNKYSEAVQDAVRLWQKRHGFRRTGVLTFKQAALFFRHNPRVTIHKELA